MSPNSQERDEVQKIILALLLSHKNSISLKELNSEYYDQEGEHIPWKKFGNISLLDFLKCMQKYVSLEKQNNVFYARGIASDKTKHVGSLVARQKLQPQKLSGNRKTYKPSHYYPKTASPRIQIPADILSNIVYTVRQHPKGISKNHILHMVQNKLPYIDITMNELEEQLRELSHEIFIKSNLLFPSQNNITQKGTGIKDIINTQENKNPDRKSQTVNEPMYCVAGDENTNSKALYINIDDDYQHLSPPSVSKSNLSEEKKTRKKQNISNFIQETVFKCQRETVEQDQTLPNEVEQQRNFEEVDSYYCNDSEKFKLQLDNIEYQERSSNIDNDFASILISDRLRFRLKKLIEAHPDGIWCAQLPEKYFETYNISLNYTELGFNSVREFISYLPDIFQYNQPLCSGDFILYDASKNEIPIEGKETVRNENIAELYNLYLNKDDAEALPAILSADTCKKLTPDSVMTIGECVGQINVVDLKYSLQPYIEVYVVEIFTPSLFWIRLRKKEKAFKNMMNALHTFYTTNSKDYMIPPVVLEKGLNCACKYNGYWHRGIIKAVKPDLQVTIMFYDYGTLKTYPPEDIHYLHRSFSNLPAQAIPCGLYNTKPCVGEQWTQGVTHVFASKASYNPLIAIIAAVDIENNSMLVTLTDTSEEEDIHINDWLVSQNLAVHGRMVRIRPRNFVFQTYKDYYNKSKQNSTDDYNHCKNDFIKNKHSSVFIENSNNNSILYDLYTDLRRTSSASVKNISNNGSDNYTKTESKNVSKVVTPTEICCDFSQKIGAERLTNDVTISKYKGSRELLSLHEKCIQSNDVHSCTETVSRESEFNRLIDSNINCKNSTNCDKSILNDKKIFKNIEQNKEAKLKLPDMVFSTTPLKLKGNIYSKLLKEREQQKYKKNSTFLNTKQQSQEMKSNIERLSCILQNIDKHLTSKHCGAKSFSNEKYSDISCNMYAGKNHQRSADWSKILYREEQKEMLNIKELDKHIKSDDNMSTQVQENKSEWPIQKQGSPLLNAYFLNAVRLSEHPEHHIENYDMLSDDNLNNVKNISSLMIRQKTKFAIKNIDTMVTIPKRIFVALRSGIEDIGNPISSTCSSEKSDINSQNILPNADKEMKNCDIQEVSMEAKSNIATNNIQNIFTLTNNIQENASDLNNSFINIDKIHVDNVEEEVIESIEKSNSCHFENQSNVQMTIDQLYISNLNNSNYLNSSATAVTNPYLCLNMNKTLNIFKVLMEKENTSMNFSELDSDDVPSFTEFSNVDCKVKINDAINSENIDKRQNSNSKDIIHNEDITTESLHKSTACNTSSKVLAQIFNNKDTLSESSDNEYQLHKKEIRNVETIQEVENSNIIDLKNGTQSAESSECKTGNQLILRDTTKACIPVLNDVDVESIEEEEWDVNIELGNILEECSQSNLTINEIFHRVINNKHL